MARYVPLGRAATRTGGAVSRTGRGSGRRGPRPTGGRRGGGGGGPDPSRSRSAASSTSESDRRAPRSAEPYEERSTVPVSSRKRRGSGRGTAAAPRGDAR